MSPADLAALLAERETAACVEHVHFADADFRVEDYSRIAELQNLRIVTLCSTTNTDSVVTTLVSLDSVEEFGFYDTDLSDSGLSQIQMPGLKELSVQCYGDQISDEAEQEARDRLPNCSVNILREDE